MFWIYHLTSGHTRKRKQKEGIFGIKLSSSSMGYLQVFNFSWLQAPRTWGVRMPRKKIPHISQFQHPWRRRNCIDHFKAIFFLFLCAKRIKFAFDISNSGCCQKLHSTDQWITFNCPHTHWRKFLIHLRLMCYLVLNPMQFHVHFVHGVLRSLVLICVFWLSSCVSIPVLYVTIRNKNTENIYFLGRETGRNDSWHGYFWHPHSGSTHGLCRDKVAKSEFSVTRSGHFKPIKKSLGHFMFHCQKTTSRSLQKPSTYASSSFLVLPLS